MIGFLAGLGAAFGGLAVLKGVLEPAARQVFRLGVDQLLQGLPKAYDMLDPFWPSLEETLSPEELEQVVREALATVTGEDWSRASIRAQAAAIEEFFARRDSRIAAAKRLAHHPVEIEP